MSLVQVLDAFITTLKRWPRSMAELRSLSSRFSSVSALQSHLKRNASRWGGQAKVLPVTPRWLLTGMRGELGRDAAWLGIPQVRNVLIMGASRGWTDDKIQALIENTGWWRGRNDRQRNWTRMLAGERKQAIDGLSSQVYNTLRQLFGVEYIEKKGWTLESKAVRGIAYRVAKGDWDFQLWATRRLMVAELVPGTPAYNARQDELRAAGAEEVAVENLAGELEEEWRAWMGDAIEPSEAILMGWAKEMHTNKSSRKDWQDFLVQQSQSLYPNKPERVPFSTYVAPAKQMVSQLLELGHVGDDDALIQSYVQGQVPTLADLRSRLMQDPRIGRTAWMRDQSRGVGMALLKGMGLA